jgi:hypothetical protein
MSPDRTPYQVVHENVFLLHSIKRVPNHSFRPIALQRQLNSVVMFTFTNQKGELVLFVSSSPSTLRYLIVEGRERKVFKTTFHFPPSTLNFLLYLKCLFHSDIFFSQFWFFNFSCRIPGNLTEEDLSGSFIFGEWLAIL